VFAVFPSLKAAPGMNDKQLGRTGVGFLCVDVFGCSIGGQLADQFSKRRLVVLSLVVGSTVTIVYGFAGSACLWRNRRVAARGGQSLRVVVNRKLVGSVKLPMRTGRLTRLGFVMSPPGGRACRPAS
jgi:MFS family permease